MDLTNEELPNLVHGFPREIETGRIEGQPYIATALHQRLSRFGGLHTSGMVVEDAQ